MPNVNTDLPRVTWILQEAGLIDTTWYTEEACNRGTLVHLACQYLDEEALDWDTVDPSIEGYVRAYGKWRHDSGNRAAQWIECPMQDPKGLYRGTADRILADRPRAILDVKTGPRQKWIALQLAAYVNMMDDPYSYRRFSLHLRQDGTYDVVEYPRAEYSRDLVVFMSALNIANWRKGRTS